MELHKLFNGKIISIIWGLGLATILRHACIERQCIIIKGPHPYDIENNNYKFNDKCYKYEAESVSCPI
tara:strand:+ start:374 stop:577 length:204 start_codon:yes stop_codon:yes gene_type:complete